MVDNSKKGSPDSRDGFYVPLGIIDHRFWLWFRYGMVREYHSAVTINLAKRLEIPMRNFSRNELYSMSTICSFKLKPKLRKIPKGKPFTHSLGEYIRHERLKKHLSQSALAKVFGVNGVALSMWELNRKPVHPKRFNAVIDFLGYVPKKSSKFDKLGTRTQLWRLQNDVSLQEFSELLNISVEEITRIETARYCKIDREISETITSFINTPLISHAVLS